MKTNRKPTSTWWAAETKNPVHSPSHTPIRRPVRSVALGASVLTAIWLPAQIASAQAVYYDRPLSQLIEQMEPSNPPSGVNGTRWITRGEANAAVDLANNNTISWFTLPGFDPQDLDWRSGGYSAQFQSNIFTSIDSTRRNLFLLHQDLSQTEPRRIKWTVEHATFENVNFDPGTVQFSFKGSALSWTMSNSRFEASQGRYTPTFYATAPLTLSSIGGSNELVGWSDQVASVTSLIVTGGTSLKFTDAGDIDSTSYADQLRFELAGNKADINGGTLTLNRSGVVFVTGGSATVNAGVVTEGFVVRNGGSLVLEGSPSSLAATKLEVFGSMLVDSSSIELANRTKLIFNDTFTQGAELKLNNASVTVNGGALLSGAVAFFSGTNTVTSTSELNSAGFQAGFALQNSATTVNVRGAGLSFAAGAFFLNGGTVAVGNGSTLGLKPFGGVGLSTTTGRLTIASGGTVEIRPGFALSLGGGLILDNQGTMNVLGGLRGNGTMTGPGDVVVDNDGVVEVSNQSFSVAGDVTFMSGSSLALRLDPTAQTLQSLFVSGLSFNTGEFGLPSLSLFTQNDTALPVGTKFLLADYNSLTGNINAPHFRDLPEGQVFQSGRNQYQIRYSDVDYGASHSGNSSVITLTVVSNGQPSPGADNLDRPTTTRVVKVLRDTLLSNDTDPDGQPLAIVAVGNALPTGATVALSGKFVVYTAPAANAGDGSFEYTVSNPPPDGKSATGHVAVHQVAPTGSGPNSARIVKVGSDVVLTFIGVPGRNYRLQYTTSGSPPYVWNDFSPAVTLRAPDSGVFTSTDINPPNPLRLYRAVLNP